MLTIDIHGLGRECAEKMRIDIFNKVASIDTTDWKSVVIEICDCNIKNLHGVVVPQLRVFMRSFVTDSNKRLLIQKLQELDIAIMIIDVYYVRQ